MCTCTFHHDERPIQKVTGQASFVLTVLALQGENFKSVTAEALSKVTVKATCDEVSKWVILSHTTQAFNMANTHAHTHTDAQKKTPTQHQGYTTQCCMLT
jgi:hypothetical protein